MTKKLLIYDASEAKPVGLSWKVGAEIFKNQFTFIIAATSWDQLIKEINSLAKKNVKFDECQFWGHGSPGKLFINKQEDPDDFWFKLKEIMNNRGHIWLRVCAFANGQDGHENMEFVAAATNCFVYAHTYNIGTWAAQSGLVRLAPGADAKWSMHEGLHPKTGKLLSSSWLAPRTFSALQMKIPTTFTFG